MLFATAAYWGGVPLTARSKWWGKAGGVQGAVTLCVQQRQGTKEETGAPKGWKME